MKRQFIFYAILGAIALLSFLLFSSVFFPLFNSDDGVTVLMLHYFKFPDDLYFWGQDRVGSIIPLLGQLFYKGFGFSSLWAESITHSIILILGYVAYSTLIRSMFSKIIFALVWFFPIIYFTSLVRFSFGLQYSLIGIAVYLINEYSLIKHDLIVKRFLTLLTIFFVFILSVWVTETAIVTIFLTVIIVGYFSYKSNKNIKSLLFRFETLFVLIAVVLGFFIISVLKNNAIIGANYSYNKQMFNSLQEILESIQIVTKNLLAIFSFKTPDIPVSVYSYLVLILLVFIIFIKGKFKTIPPSCKKWILVFLLDGTLLFFIIIISHWALMNGVARRYFTGVYISYWLALLMYTDYIIESRKKVILQFIIALTVLIGASSSIYSFKYVYPKTLTSKVKIVKEFEQLGKIGLIGEYWNSYGISFVNPSLIKATPNDKSEVRNYALVDSVFNQPKLFIIKDMWLESFPDSITQFGRKLHKKGEMFNLGNCWVCEYEKE